MIWKDQGFCFEKLDEMMVPFTKVSKSGTGLNLRRDFHFGMLCILGIQMSIRPLDREFQNSWSAKCEYAHLHGTATQSFIFKGKVVIIIIFFKKR